MKCKHGLGNEIRHKKIPAHIPCTLHVLEDVIRDRSMQTLHEVCHAAYSNSRFTAGCVRKRKIVLKFVASSNLF